MQNRTGTGHPSADSGSVLSIIWQADAAANFNHAQTCSIPLTNAKTSAYLKGEFDRFGSSQPIPVFWHDYTQFSLYIQWAQSEQLDTSSISFPTLIELWMLGDMLKDITFKDTTMSYLVHAVSQQNVDPNRLIALLDPRAIQQIWKTTTEYSQMRSFVVDMAAIFADQQQINEYRKHHNELRAFTGALNARLELAVPALVVPRNTLSKTIKNGNAAAPGEALGNGPLAKYLRSIYGQNSPEHLPPIDLRPKGHPQIKRLLLPPSALNVRMIGLGDMDGSSGWDHKFDVSTLHGLALMAQNMFNDPCRYHEHGYRVEGPACPTTMAWNPEQQQTM